MDLRLLITISIIATIFEIIRPRVRSRFFLKETIENYFYLLIYAFIFSKINSFIVSKVSFFSESSFFNLSSLPIYIQFPICFILYDFARYALHTLMHKSSVLWNIHKLHHTTQSLSASSGFRNSYYEDLSLSIFSIFVVAIFEFKESYILYSEIILTTHGLFCHCNFNIRFPKYLRWIADPYFHASHHIADSKLMHSNYGVTFTFYDKILGSYQLPEDLHFNDLGLPDKNDPIYKKNPLLRYFYLPLYKNKDNKKKDHLNQ